MNSFSNLRRVSLKNLKEYSVVKSPNSIIVIFALSSPFFGKLSRILLFNAGSLQASSPSKRHRDSGSYSHISHGNWISLKLEALPSL